MNSSATPSPPPPPVVESLLVLVVPAVSVVYLGGGVVNVGVYIYIHTAYDQQIHPLHTYKHTGAALERQDAHPEGLGEACAGLPYVAVPECVNELGVVGPMDAAASRSELPRPNPPERTDPSTSTWKVLSKLRTR